jgi:YVTN family beta-propeller protein
MTRRLARCIAVLLVTAAGSACARGTGISTIPIDGHPSAVTVAGGLVWVTDDTNHSVHVVDADSGEVTGRPIEVARNPIAITGSRDAVWIAHASGKITRIDVRSRRASKPIALHGSFTSIALAGERVWVTDVERGLYGIDVRDHDDVLRRPLKNGAVRVIRAGGDLWVTGREDTVTRFDPTSGASRDVDVGAGPIGLASDGERIWVADSDDGTATAVDETTGKVVRTVEVGRGPVAVVVTGGSVCVANQDDATVSRIDPGSGEVDGEPLAIGTHPRGLATSEGRLWVVGSNPDALVRVEL